MFTLILTMTQTLIPTAPIMILIATPLMKPMMQLVMMIMTLLGYVVQGGRMIHSLVLKLRRWKCLYLADSMEQICYLSR